LFADKNIAQFTLWSATIFLTDFIFNNEKLTTITLLNMSKILKMNYINIKHANDKWEQCYNK